MHANECSGCNSAQGAELFKWGYCSTYFKSPIDIILLLLPFYAGHIPIDLMRDESCPASEDPCSSSRAGAPAEHLTHPRRPLAAQALICLSSVCPKVQGGSLHEQVFVFLGYVFAVCPVLARTINS